MILWHNERELSSPGGQGVTRITLQPLWLGMLRNSLGTHWLWSWRQVSASDSPGHLVWLPCQLHWAGFTSAPGKGRGALPAHLPLYGKAIHPFLVNSGPQPLPFFYLHCKSGVDCDSNTSHAHCILFCRPWVQTAPHSACRGTPRVSQHCSALQQHFVLQVSNSCIKREILWKENINALSPNGECLSWLEILI